jgi:hypothetical protein
MMINLAIRTLMIPALCFVGGFLGTVIVRTQPAKPPSSHEQSPIARWLRLDEPQARAVNELDPEFPEELAVLRQSLEKGRLELASLFEETSATDDALRRQVEATIEAHNRLERRIAEHLIKVRQHLTPAQQTQLFNLVAEGVRHCRQRRWVDCPGCCGRCEKGGSIGSCPVLETGGGQRAPTRVRKQVRLSGVMTLPFPRKLGQAR